LRPYAVRPLRPYAVRPLRPYAVRPLRPYTVRRCGAASALARASPLSLRKHRSIYGTRRACSLPLAAPLHHPPVAALRRPPVAALRRPP